MEVLNCSVKKLFGQKMEVYKVKKYSSQKKCSVKKIYSTIKLNVPFS